MKRNFILILFSLFIAMISSYVHSDDHIFFEIESVTYDNKEGGIRANIILNNGYRFIFAPGVENEFLLSEIETNFLPGKRVVIEVHHYTTKYWLFLKDEPDSFGYSFCLSKETAQMLPTIQNIHKRVISPSGWFSSEKKRTFITLSNGTKWECASDFFERFVNGWEKGDKVLFTEDVTILPNSKIVLININPKNKEYGRECRRAEMISTCE